MANSKISALTSATTPLAGTETLPVVQSSTTKQVSIANLTAGRAVSASSLALTTALPVTSGGTGTGTAFTAGSVVFAGASGVYSQNNSQFFWDNTNTRLGIRTSSPGQALDVSGVGRFGDLATKINIGLNGDSISSDGDMYIQTSTSNFLSFRTNFTEAIRLQINQDVKVTNGNVVQGTAAKGVNFTANTPAAGMTSQLLNWYEEGTFTPNQGAGLTLVGAFSSTGKYTRIGRQVSISGTVTGATSVAVTAAGVITSNLPFTVGTAGHGDATNAAVTASATVICTSTSVTSAAAIAATGTITFSATYFV
jgi:hypothetical protein